MKTSQRKAMYAQRDIHNMAKIWLEKPAIDFSQMQKELIKNGMSSESAKRLTEDANYNHTTNKFDFSLGWYGRQ